MEDDPDGTKNLFAAWIHSRSVSGKRADFLCPARSVFQTGGECREKGVMRYTKGMNKQTFQESLAKDGLRLDERQLNQFEQYLHLLQEWNQKMNLTAITQEEEVWEKHFYDSVVPFLHADFKTLADVGSGAGFPGIPLAIVWPDREFTLIEPLAKRCKFLEEVKKQLKLTNVTIVNERAEDFVKTHRGQFDAVSARAVARLSILLELCIPLLKPDGVFIALKGAAGLTELKNAAPALKALHVEATSIDQFELGKEGERIIITFRKTAPTPAKYPRNYSLIKKKPLEDLDG